MNFTTQLNKIRQLALTSVVIALTSVTLNSLLIDQAHAQSKKGSASVVAAPFGSDTWHAVEGSWPGTIIFNEKSKSVVLSPLSSPPITANYTYTINGSESLPAKKGEVGQTGTLTMTNTAGQVSSATFEIKNNKTMSLQFKGGVRSEVYLKMTKAEETAEMNRIRSMIETGKFVAKPADNGPLSILNNR